MDSQTFKRKLQGSQLIGLRIYIIEKFLERKYLKWAHMAHLGI